MNVDKNLKDPTLPPEHNPEQDSNQAPLPKTTSDIQMGFRGITKQETHTSEGNQKIDNKSSDILQNNTSTNTTSKLDLDFLGALSKTPFMTKTNSTVDKTNNKSSDILQNNTSTNTTPKLDLDFFDSLSKTPFMTETNSTDDKKDIFNNNNFFDKDFDTSSFNIEDSFTNIQNTFDNNPFIDDSSSDSSSSSPVKKNTNIQNIAKESKLPHILENFDVITTNVSDEEITNCQVIIIGESHDDEKSLRLQEQLITCLWENNECVLLTEIEQGKSLLFPSSHVYDQNLIENITTTIQSWDDPEIQTSVGDKFFPKMTQHFIEGELLFKITEKCASEVNYAYNLTLPDELDSSTLEVLQQKFKDIDIGNEYKEIRHTIIDTCTKRKEVSEQNIALLQHKLSNNELSPHVLNKLLEEYLDKILTGEVELQATIDSITQSFHKSCLKAKDKFNKHLENLYDFIACDLQIKSSKLLELFEDKFPFTREEFLNQYSLSEEDLSKCVDFSSVYIDPNLIVNQVETLISNTFKDKYTPELLDDCVTQCVKQLKSQLLFEPSQNSIQNTTASLGKLTSFINSTECTQYINKSIMHNALSEKFSDWKKKNSELNSEMSQEINVSIDKRNQHMAKKIQEQIKSGKKQVFITAGCAHIDVNKTNTRQTEQAVHNLYKTLKNNKLTYYAVTAKTTKELTNKNNNNLEGSQSYFSKKVQSDQEKHLITLEKISPNRLALHDLELLCNTLQLPIETSLGKLSIDWKSFLEI